MGTKACVTIGAKMKRDKLIQACMRMRKLGQGHFVTFYLSRETCDKIGAISTKSVLNWVCQNTKEFNEDGLLYWAIAGRNYAQRLVAEDNFHYPLHEIPSEVITSYNFEPVFQEKAEILANQCVDDEVVRLKEMYGQYVRNEPLYTVIPRWFSYTKQKLQRINGDDEIESTILQRVDRICAQVVRRCLEHVETRYHMCSGMMEEEQEKELELEKETEVEEQRQVERPRKAEELKPSLHAQVKKTVLSGESIKLENGGVVKLCEIFKGTSFWELVQPDGWADEVYATKDFISVIRTDSKSYSYTDDYLRPIQYMVSFDTGELMLLSPFEVNELMPYFRNGEAKCTLHMFSQRKAEKQELLLNNGRLQLPAVEEGDEFMESSRVVAALLLASGSLYFKNMEEQIGYLDFLSLAPQPWSSKEKEANQQGMITKSGFLLPKGRQFPENGFQKDPTELITKVLDCRHPVVSEYTHIMRILEKKRKIEFTEASVQSSI